MSTEAAEKSALPRYAFAALKLAVSVVLLAVLFSISHVDIKRLWIDTRNASFSWMLVAPALFAATVVAGTWRWHLLLEAQGVRIAGRRLLASFLVATFFNNFLPSNIGGDVIRIGDTARAAGSKTLATMIVLVDRVLGLMGLVLVAAVAATMAAGGDHPVSPIWPSWLWAGFLLGSAAIAPAVLAPAGLGRILRLLAIVHAEWVEERIETLTAGLGRFRHSPRALAGTFAGAVFVQALTVAYYLVIVYALRIPIGLWDLAVIVPMSFVVQMLPVSINGFGVREATFSLYFRRLGLPIQSAVLLPLVATALSMLFSLSGAAVYVSRNR